MEVQIVKKECTDGWPPIVYHNEVITKFEIMDGEPINGETIPVRLHLKPFALTGKLTPTQRAIRKKLNVSFFLKILMVDEDDRQYFQQRKITLYQAGEAVAG